ncbi:hypothetical protein [Pedobacter caeni]|uniref:Lipoprotein n=1 Tax=Pedobacter caeni TaxID=288992 RepID=A0A1M5JTS0_9SPHI|nr:hypothetical protein [Pedobacter caeni]SHG43373.1 hypothetical protein SAMN04488522_105490 [Pedobacter caeni]
MKKLSSQISAFALLLMASSCGSDTVYPQNENGGKAVKSIIEKKFDPEKQVEELEIKSKDELYGELGKVTIVYWEGEKQMEQVYSASEGFSDKLFEPEETFASKSDILMSKNTKGKTAAIKTFDVEPIPSKVAEAVAFIPKEFENYALNKYVFSVDKNGKIQQQFTINTTKKGEGKTQTGRVERQNYYGFEFKVDENGKVVAVEE